ncbi:MAG: BC1881 family protein [Clostridiales bacterium]|nr:BC1881 family protein [Clostridiales bacterium]
MNQPILTLTDRPKSTYDPNRKEVRILADSLNNIPTKSLVEELQKREGVEATIAKPYQDKTVSVNGPSIVLVVLD